MVRGVRGGGEPAVEPAVIKTRPAPSVPNDGASLTLITGTFSFHRPRNTGESANRSNPEETFKFTARTMSRRRSNLNLSHCLNLNTQNGD